MRPGQAALNDDAHDFRVHVASKRLQASNHVDEGLPHVHLTGLAAVAADASDTFSQNPGQLQQQVRAGQQTSIEHCLFMLKPRMNHNARITLAPELEHTSPAG